MAKPIDCRWWLRRRLLQLPDAVQPVAFVDDQVSVVELPDTIELSANVSVGAAGVAGRTVRLTDGPPVGPAALLQLSVYV